MVERRCAGCGCWNHAAEARCQRCGRKLETSLGAEGRRELEETESLPGPAAEILPSPRRAPKPEWRDELSRRLAGYRQRKAAIGEPPEGLDEPSNAETAQLPVSDRHGKHNLPPSQRQTAPSLPPIRNRASEPSAAAQDAPHRLTEPPIVDRLLSQHPRLTVRPTRPPVEELLAPIRYRFIAGLLDLGVAAVALGVFLVVMHLTNPAVLAGPNRMAIVGGSFVTLLVIYWIVYLRLMGSTAGMRWTGLRVMNLDAEPPDAQQRWMRALGTVLSGAALGMGFLWSLFDEQHFTWHDRVSKTFVGMDD